MKLLIEIPEAEYNECVTQVELMKQEGILIESLNTALRIFVANGIPQEEKQTDTANWVGIDQEPHEDWECTHCGFIIYGMEEPYRFCPNCGRKMKGEE